MLIDEDDVDDAVLEEMRQACAKTRTSPLDTLAAVGVILLRRLIEKELGERSQRRAARERQQQTPKPAA